MICDSESDARDLVTEAQETRLGTIQGLAAENQRLRVRIQQLEARSSQPCGSSPVCSRWVRDVEAMMPASLVRAYGASGGAGGGVGMDRSVSCVPGPAQALEPIEWADDLADDLTGEGR